MDLQYLQYLKYQLNPPEEDKTKSSQSGEGSGNGEGSGSGDGSGGGDLDLDDILDVFQGPVANEGAIILATTNNYEQILKMCPRLFRDGRLKPVYFGYLEREVFSKVVNYYFKTELAKDWQPALGFPIRIPISQILTMITDIKLELGDVENSTSAGYEEFLQMLNMTIRDKRTIRQAKIFEKYEDK